MPLIPVRPKVIRMGSTALADWFNVPGFRTEAVERCERLAERFRCSVELRGPDESVVYKTFA